VNPQNIAVKAALKSVINSEIRSYAGNKKAAFIAAFRLKLEEQALGVLLSTPC
jgi:hypothetical protein